MIYSVLEIVLKKINSMFPVSIGKCSACEYLDYVFCNSKCVIEEYKSTTLLYNILFIILFLLGTFKISYDGVVLLNIEPTSGVVEPKSVKTVKVDICTDVPRIIKEVIK